VAVMEGIFQRSIFLFQEKRRTDVTLQRALPKARCALSNARSLSSGAARVPAEQSVGRRLYV
jgi:hypothetical protein